MFFAAMNFLLISDISSTIREARFVKAVNKLFERVIMQNEREVAIAPLARFRVAFLARTFSKLARKKCIVSVGRYCRCFGGRTLAEWMQDAGLGYFLAVL
jgi:hypothetical protein